MSAVDEENLWFQAVQITEEGVTPSGAALQELHRVLRPGSKVAILDFNNTDNQLVDWFQGFSLDNIVVPAARMYNLAEEYEYLRPSIKRFATGAPSAS